MHSKDTIRLAIAYKEEEHTFAELEKVFGMTRPTYYNCKKKLEDGYYDQKRVVHERKRKIDKQALIRAITEKPDLYLRELAVMFNCSEVSIFTALRKLKITRKKNLSHIPKSRKKNVPNT
jgi:transposase